MPGWPRLAQEYPAETMPIRVHLENTECVNVRMCFKEYEIIFSFVFLKKELMQLSDEDRRKAFSYGPSVKNIDASVR